MSIELKVPEVGESISEAMIGEWLKKEGDRVEKDENLVIIETDKVTVELPSPESGVLAKIVKGDGEDAAVGEVIGILEPGEASGGGESAAAPADDATGTDSDGEAAGDTDAAEADGERVMPAARRLLEEHGLSASDVAASGPGGRLLKEDVLRHVEGGAAEAPATEEPAEAKPAESKEKEASKPPEAEPPPAPQGDRTEETVRMTPLRRRVAQRLVEAQQTAAMLTTFNEIDMSEVIALRSRYKEAFQEAHGVKLGFMSFFVKAAIEALKAIPQVNAEIRGDEVVYRHYQDIGIAVGGGRGLVVPVLRNAERMSFAEVEKKIGDFGRRARDNKLSLDEIQGGTFTISNGGIYGSLLSTPILNPPQSGILGLHKIEERPIALDGQVVIRPMMYVALSYDHRIVDGREAVTFLVRLKERIEDPSRILLEV